ncbi:hypothetical protein AURDEDRAFT_166621 [Auricularia subglabra TFB-10046 SS5]|nr:hypothetical protein AURDEDRAFT_166621 [Auricularia subglabra TFB-10046 SS5]
MSNVRVALQLSSREGLEVKVAEAIRIIATRAGGIPLQVQHGKSDVLVEVDEAQQEADDGVGQGLDADAVPDIQDGETPVCTFASHRRFTRRQTNYRGLPRNACRQVELATMNIRLKTCQDTGLDA